MSSLGRSRSGAAGFWAAAIACFVAACAVLGASAAKRTADAWAKTLDGAVTVRILTPNLPGAAEAAAAVLREVRGVDSARAMSEARARELIGEDVRALPDLRLVEVELAYGGPRMPALVQEALEREGFAVEVFGPGPWAAEAAAAARRLARLALGAALLAGGGAALIVPLLARVRARAEHETLAAFIECGAKPGQGLGALARRAALEGFGAGLLGALAAGALAFGLVAGAAPAAPLLQQLNLFRPQDLAVLAGLALLAGALAGAGARAAGRRLWLETEGRA